MLVSFNYRPRKSVVESFDPRARWIFSLLILTTIVLFWDMRFLFFFFALSLVQFYLSRLTWRETRRAWLLIFFLTSTMIVVNTIITGAGTIEGVMAGGTPVLQFQLNFPFTDWHIQYVLTQERLWFALAQYLRVLSIAGLFIVIPFTMAPRIYGATFKGIGLPDKLAFTMDLSFRFIPTLIRDYQVTVDAQRARGFEIEKAEGGLFARIRRVAPLLVPVTMNAILAGEDIANAMDLRCFGLKKRTWVEALKFQWRDYVLIGLAVAIFVVSLILRFGYNMGDFLDSHLIHRGDTKMDSSQHHNEPEHEYNQQFTNRLIANQLTVRQGAANSVETNELTMRQAAAGKIRADQVHTNASAVGFLQAQTADVANSSVAFANVAGNVVMDQSGANVLVSTGDVSMDQCGSVVMVTRSVVMKNSSTAFLFAQHVEGDVTTLFGSRDALLFGTAAGLVGGMVILIGRMFRRRR